MIDPAMKHESTINDEKANYYNVLINYSLMELSGYGEFEDLKIYQNDSIQDVLEVSIKKASGKKRWKGEMDDFFNRKVSQAIMIGEMMFKQKNFEMAYAGFAGAYQVKVIAGIEEERDAMRSEEHTSELQSRPHLVCRLLLEKKKNISISMISTISMI